MGWFKITEGSEDGDNFLHSHKALCIVVKVNSAIAVKSEKEIDYLIIN